MKRILPMLLSMTGLLLMAQINAPRKTPRVASLPEELSNSIVSAQKDYLKARALAKTNPAAAPEVIKAREELQVARTKAASEPAHTPLASATTPAPAEEVAALVTSAAGFDAQVQPLAQSAETLEKGLIWVALLLGVVSSVLSSFNWNRAAAGVSALVVVASGVPNIYPVHERATYYQALANQSHSLNSALALAPKLTIDEYDNDVRRQAAMESAITFPGTAAGDPATGLLTALDASKISTLAAP